VWFESLDICDFKDFKCGDIFNMQIKQVLTGAADVS